jgi:hypothetical protein
VPLVAAAVCPHPPLLLPSVAAGAAPELDDLRTACFSAVDRVFAAEPETIVVVGAGASSARFGGDDFGSFDAFGVRETYALGGIDALAVGVRMPLSLAVGAWLLRERRTGPRRSGLGVAADTTARGCGSLGADLAGRPERVGLIIMGDGSACRGEKSPGYADPRAEAFDASVAKALAAADPAALLELDASLADELLVAGRAPWQVLAGSVLAAGGSWRGDVLYDAAPYGVCYLVASWLPA